ncbi:MAG: hypothetical protein ACO1NS_10170 [Daejeonella sp.]|uniref:hypothetical protein n=1 Tax=Daejeonella sp. JGW-45 TaxID=3034148 RepID=UPI0023ECFD66|nr:hypothetical protein [Daejeonella sp. JGW-45]
MNLCKQIPSFDGNWLPWKIQKAFVLALSVFFLSCQHKTLTDNRPSDQKSFVALVKELKDRAEKIPLSDGNRPVVIDNDVKRLKAYITDTLNSRFANWDARVLDNKMTDPNGGDTRITFGISIDDFNLDETSRFKSIVFRESLGNLQPPLREKLQNLKVGDHVKISGSFVTRDKKIDVDPYNVKEFKISKNIFSNPEFRTDITDLVQAQD